MVPIHDTDVAEERWSKGEWENYELWEKVEVRLRRNRRVWIGATVLVFLALSAIPIVMDRWQKWATRELAKDLALEINRVKKDAAISRTPLRLVITSQDKFEFSVSQVSSCDNKTPQINGPTFPNSPATPLPKPSVRTGVLAGGKWEGRFTVINSEQAEKLGIPGIVNEYCYDPYQGSSVESKPLDAVGFGIIPVKDLTENRIDRLTVLLLTGASADISFD